MPSESSDGKVRCQKHDVRSRSTPWTIPDRCCTLPRAYVNQGGVLGEQGFGPVGPLVWKLCHLTLSHFSSWRSSKQCRTIVWLSFFVVLVLVFVLVLVLVLALLLFLVSFCFCLLIGQSTNTEASWLLHKCCYETTVAFWIFPHQTAPHLQSFLRFVAALYASLLSFLRASFWAKLQKAYSLILIIYSIHFFNFFQKMKQFKTLTSDQVHLTDPNPLFCVSVICWLADLHRTVARLFRLQVVQRHAVTKWEHYLCKNIEKIVSTLENKAFQRRFESYFLSHSRWSQIENIFIFECIFTSHPYIMDVHLYIHSCDISRSTVRCQICHFFRRTLRPLQVSRGAEVWTPRCHMTRTRPRGWTWSSQSSWGNKNPTSDFAPVTQKSTKNYFASSDPHHDMLGEGCEGF